MSKQKIFTIHNFKKFLKKLQKRFKNNYKCFIRLSRKQQKLIKRFFKTQHRLGVFEIKKRIRYFLQKKRKINQKWQKKIKLLKKKLNSHKTIIRLTNKSFKKLVLNRKTKNFFSSISDIKKQFNQLIFVKIPWIKFFGKFELIKLRTRFYKNLRNWLSSFFSPVLCRLYLSLTVTLIILGGSWFIYRNIFADLPDPMDLTKTPPVMTTRILDRNGKLLFRIYQDENRTIVPLDEISQNLINATIAIEDRSFYQHHGFSLKGIFRAFVRNIKDEQTHGGSTITQQLVKNRLLGREKTLKRKIKELILSILVEGTYSKEEILQMYLNEVAYGGSTYGIEEASWRFFNKSAKELTLGESALLAGLPAAPSIYSPFGSNPELSFRRQEEVLRRMVEDGYITFEDAYRARQETLSFRPDVIDINAPHFVMYVKKLLAERFGEKMVNQDGLEVRTSLDLNLQQQTQEIVTRNINALGHLNITNGAALVTNPQTGEILAMVGSKNYFDFEHDGQVNVTIRPRQPGSSIKPLTYALAFEKGKQPWDYVDDAPITYQIPGSRPYSPRNYDGQFRGRVTLRQALASSYNIPAVKLLAELGVENLVDKGKEMGISTWTDSSRFGLSLTLGAGEVLMTDLAEVYGTFATGGFTVELDPLLEVRDHEGALLYRNPCFANPGSCHQLQTLENMAAYQISDILSDDHARSSTFGLYSLLNIPQQQVAVKTGTTNDKRDNWTIGYISDRLVGVWVGNNDNSPMSYVASGMTGASPIWNEVMRLLLDANNPHRFVLSPDLIKVRICVPTNTLPCTGCPLVAEELFVKGREPKQACNPSNFIQSETTSPVGEREQI